MRIEAFKQRNQDDRFVSPIAYLRFAMKMAYFFTGQFGKVITH